MVKVLNLHSNLGGKQDAFKGKQPRKCTKYEPFAFAYVLYCVYFLQVLQQNRNVTVVLWQLLCIGQFRLHDFIGCRVHVSVTLHFYTARFDTSQVFLHMMMFM